MYINVEEDPEIRFLENIEQLKFSHTTLEGGNFNESGKSVMSYNRSKYLRLNRVISVL